MPHCLPAFVANPIALEVPPPHTIEVGKVKVEQGEQKEAKNKAPRKMTRAEANARRMKKRIEDDFVRCPRCLGRPWGRGRSSNCREHIARAKCRSHLVGAIVSKKTRRGYMLWDAGNGRCILASTRPGPLRKSRRTYYSGTLLKKDDAESLWELAILEQEDMQTVPLEKALREPVWSVSEHITE